MEPGTESPTLVCYRHPDRVTRLRCSECGRPICVECSHDAAVGQKCPECSAPQGRHRVIDAGRRVRRGPGFDTAPVTFTIIGISVALFGLGMISPDLDRWLFENLAQVNLLIADGEWWRIFTAALLHASITHIFFNMYALYLFGPRLEMEVGSVPFAALYVASAAAGSATSFLLGPEVIMTARGPVAYVAVGASGAIFGLFGAWMFVAWRLRNTPAGQTMLRQFGVLLAINAALPLLIRNIDWRAHAGGFVAGFVIAFLWNRFAHGRENATTLRTVIALGFVALALVAVLAA